MKKQEEKQALKEAILNSLSAGNSASIAGQHDAKKTKCSH